MIDVSPPRTCSNDHHVPYTFNAQSSLSVQSFVGLQQQRSSLVPSQAPELLQHSMSIWARELQGTAPPSPKGGSIPCDQINEGYLFRQRFLNVNVFINGTTDSIRSFLSVKKEDVQTERKKL